MAMEPQPHTLSISQVQSYLACPLKYRFQYVEKIPRPWQPAALAFGSSVHIAIEWFHRQRLLGFTPELGQVLELFDEDWRGQRKDALVFSEREDGDALARKGQEMLRLYVSEAATSQQPVAVEDPFDVELTDPESGEILEVSLRGIVDLVEEDGTLVDLKTAGRSFDAGSLERHLQLSAYALAYLLLYGQIPPLRLDVLLKTTKPRFERLPAFRTVSELSWAAQLIRSVWEAIQTEHFFPNPSWRCGECEYFAHCQRWRGEEPQRHQLVQIAG
jgi:putative RecB family exonuclease